MLHNVELFFGFLLNMLHPAYIVILFLSSMLGIIFGALPGLTATLGVALLTTLTYGMEVDMAFLSLIAIYMGGVFGGCYASIFLNIPGTSASAATAMEGFPLAQKGQAGRAVSIAITGSVIGGLVGLLIMMVLSPVIANFALQFTSFEFFLLALFGIVISGTLTAKDLVYKGWIAGLLGIALSLVGRDTLQSFPRYTFGFTQLDGGIEVVPVLIGAFGIPQVISVLTGQLTIPKVDSKVKITHELGLFLKNKLNTIRSAIAGVFIGAIPGIGEDIAAWVSYGLAKNSSKNSDNYGKGEPEGILCTETANNACIGGALIPLMTLGIPGSPPAAMLLGALMLHGISPGPMIEVEHPGFFMQVGAILFLSIMMMFLNARILSRVFIKVLKIPVTVFMPMVAVLCIIGSYSLGLNTFNLYLMIIVGVVAYFLGKMDYPIPPLIIGVILGPMADENLRRALMVSRGNVLPFFTRPVSLVLILLILLLLVSNVPFIKRLKAKAWSRLIGEKVEAE